MDWDFVIVGSGFGGSVSALRLSEKGYRVLVLEKGRRFAPGDFPRTNWRLWRWLWMPRIGFRGLFKMTFFRHITALSGVGVGGGSLVYANTLPVPKDDFFTADSWAELADWKEELAPHYLTVKRMLGATPNPMLGYPDEVLAAVAREIGRPEAHHPTEVAVYFGEPGVTVPDPFFGGEGPERTGCIGCGGCMLGCRHGAKNTLDKNYLHLAERHGCRIEPDTEVTWVRPRPGGGYAIDALQGASALPFRRQRRRIEARAVVFAGGVLGTVPLLLRLKERPDGLPHLSPKVGDFVRTNSESLIAVITRGRARDLSQGIAISSILHTDDHSHLEPVRYPAGSNFFRTLTMPHVNAERFLPRLGKLARVILRHPLRVAHAAYFSDWARQAMILLYMRTLEGHLSMRRGRSLHTGFRKGVTTSLADGPAPSAFMPEATDLAARVARHVDGMPTTLLTETLLGIPTTAHILGGSCMGSSPATGVIDHAHRVFGYDGLYVVDGSAISANPGVNPSLTIAALAERAMSLVPPKASAAARSGT